MKALKTFFISIVLLLQGSLAYSAAVETKTDYKAPFVGKQESIKLVEVQKGTTKQGAPFKFNIPAGRYFLLESSDLKSFGQGAIGHVWKVHNGLKAFALKRNFIHSADSKIEQKRVARSLRVGNFLRQHPHPHLLPVIDSWWISNGEQGSLYTTMDLLATDLYKIINSGQALDENVKAYVLYQIFDALRYLHGADMVHGDLKPSNIFIDGDVFIRVADFDLTTGRAVAKDGSTGERVRTRQECNTWDVQTYWYRAPELLFQKEYGKSSDVWAAGAILAEMLGREALFPAEPRPDHVNLLLMISDLVGQDALYKEPDSRWDVPAVRSQEEQKADFKKLTINLKKKFPEASEGAIDLLAKTLAPEPKNRITAAEALAHPFLSQWSKYAKREERTRGFRSRGDMSERLYEGTPPDFSDIENAKTSSEIFGMIKAETNLVP